jgi:hypothetical protein
MINKAVGRDPSGSRERERFTEDCEHKMRCAHHHSIHSVQGGLHSVSEVSGQ